MSGLGTLLGKLKEAGAERLVFAPDDVAYAFAGERRWALGTEKVRATTLLEAVSEILSQDELDAIPTNRPRIVRHEHDGAEYVVEVAREGGHVRLVVRLGKLTVRRESFREPPPSAPLPAAAPASAPAPEAAPRRAEKRTVRVDVDDEGNPLDTTTVDVERRKSLPHADAVKASKRDTTRPKRPSAASLARRPVHQTLIIPAAGKPAASTVIAGDPGGAHVTFLFAPGGFALEAASGVVTASADAAVVRGELYVPPSMRLRILQGPKESIVSYYRYAD
jgi:hypothetical protein